MKSTFCLQHKIVALLVLLSLLALWFVPTTTSAATATIKGYIFDDDSGATWTYDQTTDSDGIWQPSVDEGVLDAVIVWVFDSSGYPIITATDHNGVWTATVEAGEDIVVMIELEDNNLPQTYLATTDLVQIIDVEAGETVWAEDFGYGPQY